MDQLADHCQEMDQIADHCQEMDQLADHCQEMDQLAEPVFLNVYGAQESIPTFQGINSASLCSLAGRYDNPMLLGSKPP